MDLQNSNPCCSRVNCIQKMPQNSDLNFYIKKRGKKKKIKLQECRLKKQKKKCSQEKTFNKKRQMTILKAKIQLLQQFFKSIKSQQEKKKLNKEKKNLSIAGIYKESHDR